MHDKLSILYRSGIFICIPIQLTDFYINFSFQNELTRKIEDSKNLIPEWKKNLLKQKEMKKAAANSVISINNSGSNLTVNRKILIN